SILGRDDRIVILPTLSLSFPITVYLSFSGNGCLPQWARLPVRDFLRRRPLVAKKLYVGNLPYGFSDSDLQNLFAAHGDVQSAQVIMDRDTGRSKGFGFVEMSSGDQADAAIKALNG